MARKVRKLKSGEPYIQMWTKDHWINSQLSIARFYGGIVVSKFQYWVSEAGDLVWDGIWNAYQKLGRDKIIELIKAGKRQAAINAEVERVKEKQAEAKAEAERMQGEIDWNEGQPSTAADGNT